MLFAQQSIWIDTDIGDDVDDAFALALAALLPGLRLCGVSTVAGPVTQRAQLARLLLAAAGRPDLPVVAGSSTMRDGRAGPAKFSHAPLLAHRPAGANRLPSLPDAPYHNAVDEILQCSHSCAPLTLIAIGPLTNIAAALARDPTLATRVRLVAMAGKLGLPYPDWNIRCDPVAARDVLASGITATLVGMHVTMRCKLRPEQVHRLFAAALQNPASLQAVLARCVLAWRSWQRRLPILHDVLAVALAADPTLLRRAPRRVRVAAGGFSFASRRGPPNAFVCTDLDLARFHALIETFLLGVDQ